MNLINVYFLIYIVPLISIFKIVSIFIKKKLPAFCSPQRIIPISLNIISTALILFAFVSFILKYANNMEFFNSLSVFFIIFLLVTAACCVEYSYLLLRKMITDRSFKEFSILQKADHLSLSKKVDQFFNSIQKKLLMSFLAIIIVVIVVLSIVLLSDYKRTILHAVEYSGKTIAQQSASFFKENFGDSININSYLRTEFAKNSKEELKYESLSLYKKQGKEDKFTVEYSTNPDAVKSQLTDNEIESFSKITTAESFADKKNNARIQHRR